MPTADGQRGAAAYATRLALATRLTLADTLSVRRILTDWRRRYRYRCDLERLLRTGPYLIADIGLSRPEAEREAARPFWQA